MNLIHGTFCLLLCNTDLMLGLNCNIFGFMLCVCNLLLCSVQQILGFTSHGRNDITSISNHTCMLIRMNPMHTHTQLLVLMQVNL